MTGAHPVAVELHAREVMDPVMKAIDKIEERLGHSPHAALVTLPVGAWVTSAVADGLALVTNKSAYDDAARISMVVGLVGAAGALVTGLHDYSYIPSNREPSHSIATRHGVGNIIVTSLFATSYILRAQASQTNRRPSVLSRLLSLTGAGFVAYTAWLGGKLVEEQGEAVKPIIRQQNEEEKERKRLAAA